MSLMGNDIQTGSTKVSDNWADYVGGAKIKPNSPKQQTGSDFITH